MPRPSFGRGRRGVEVYLDDAGERRLLGRAEVPEDVGATYKVPLFGAASITPERFAIGTVTHPPAGGGAPVVERVVLLTPDQRPEVLPGWRPLAS
jgi:hypothetical protein